MQNHEVGLLDLSSAASGVCQGDLGSYTSGVGDPSWQKPKQGRERCEMGIFAPCARCGIGSVIDRHDDMGSRCTLCGSRR